MSVFEYVAKRTLATGHIADTRYQVDIEVSSAVPSVADIKEVARSPGGAVEVAFERQDITWMIRLAPTAGFGVELMREFLDSTESGETFRVWLWDEDAQPLLLKRIDDGHAESAFMRRGSSADDAFYAEFTALQIGAFDASGSGVPAAGGGGSGGGGYEGDSVEIYAPNVGGPTGSLGGADDSPRISGVVQILAASVGFYAGYSAGSYGSVNSNTTDFTLGSLNASGTGGFSIGFSGDDFAEEDIREIRVQGLYFGFPVDVTLVVPEDLLAFDEDSGGAAWNFTADTGIRFEDGQVYTVTLS